MSGKDAAQEEINTQSVNEAEIPTDEESLVCQVGASKEQSDDLSSAGRCVRAEPTAITWGRHTVKVKKF
jgi:hypothetical protein